MQQAGEEEVQLARALVKSVSRSADVRIGADQSLDNWRIDGGSFTIVAEKRGIDRRFGDDALAATCRELVIPILAAMAELYGYDPVEELDPEGLEPLLGGFCPAFTGEVEGAQSTQSFTLPKGAWSRMYYLQTGPALRLRKRRFNHRGAPPSTIVAVRRGEGVRPGDRSCSTLSKLPQGGSHEATGAMVTGRDPRRAPDQCVTGWKTLRPTTAR